MRSAEWRRWRLWRISRYSNMQSASSTRVCQHWRSRSSTCIRLQNDSITALSKRSPTEPIDGTSPELSARRVNSHEVNWGALIRMDHRRPGRVALFDRHAKRVGDQCRGRARVDRPADDPAGEHIHNDRAVHLALAGWDVRCRGRTGASCRPSMGGFLRDVRLPPHPAVPDPQRASSRASTSSAATTSGCDAFRDAPARRGLRETPASCRPAAGPTARRSQASRPLDPGGHFRPTLRTPPRP
jgi:hypothetical protein